MDTAKWNLIVCTGGTCFTTADEPFDDTDIFCINITIFFVAQILAYFLIFILDDLIFTFVEYLVEPIDKMQEAHYFFVTYRNVSRSFIGDMHLMPLLN